MNTQQSAQIEKLYLEMFDKLMSYARVNLDSESLAEEAVQETFRIACQKPEALCDSPNPQGWLVVTLKNTIQNIKNNRAASRTVIAQYLASAAKEFSYTEDNINLNILYANVSDLEEFKLLSEMALEGKSYQEMAEERGISIITCKKRMQRAKEKLQGKFKKYVTF